MRLLIYLAVWRRPEITELCFKGIKRLQRHPDFSTQAVAVISEVEMVPLCEKYCINWVMAENQPLGFKKNAGLKYCQTFDFDFLLEIGSDDLVLNSLLDDYKKFIAKYDFVGVQEIGLIDSVSGEARRWDDPIIYGAGRMISRKALELVNWKLWTDSRVRGMDRDSLMMLYKKGISFWQIPKSDHPKVIDIKSEVNLWPFIQQGKPYDISKILEHLTEDERSFLQCLLQKKRSVEWTEG